MNRSKPSGSTTESELIEKERQQCRFSVSELTYLLDGGRHKTDLRREIETAVWNNPRMKSEDISYMSWEQQHVHGVKRMLYFYTQLARNMKWDFTSTRTAEMEFLPRSVGTATSLMIHACAFIPTLAALGTKEQVKKWYTLARDYHILGCYAQTELGHGTNLRRLETTAHYDASDQTFTLDSPTLTSIKWWPGELGKNGNFALVMAQLYTKGKCYGMHGFMIQIRDLSSHQPMPGVTVGSIGAIMSVAGTDNGYLKLDKIKIPRENMLAKYSEVLPNGDYIKKGNDKLMYASMVNLRVLMTRDEAVLALQKACTIAARYSCVRKQGSLQPSGPEIPIADYVTQQHKILPQVAAAYAFHFTIKKVLRVYLEFLKNLDEGVVRNLGELHFVTAGVKASVTEECTAGIEIVRRSCGGHGFAQSSGFPMLLSRATASCTYEGENTVMHLQCARFLLKCAAKIFMGETLTGTVKYLSEPVQEKCTVDADEQFYDPCILLSCFKHRVQFLLSSISKSMQEMVVNGMSEAEAWNISSVRLVELARAHTSQYVLSCFIDFIEEAACPASIREVLTKLCALYGLHNMNGNARDFLKDGFLSGHQCALSEKAEIKLLMILRRDAVGLVDAFDFRDEILSSCLGAYDGNVYERLYKYAQNLPINQKEVHEEMYSLLQPFLHIGRDKLEKINSSKL